VNGKKPDPDEDLCLWLHPKGEEVADIYCLGFQEIVDLTTVNVVADGKTRERSAVWCEQLVAAINSIDPGGAQFKLVHEKVRGASTLCAQPYDAALSRSSLITPFSGFLFPPLPFLCCCALSPCSALQHLVGIMLCVIAKDIHVPFIKRVQSQTAGVGVMGIMGNKGGSAIRFKFKETTLCVVAAHLAAHRDNVAGRNADFANILHRVNFIHVSGDS